MVMKCENNGAGDAETEGDKSQRQTRIRIYQLQELRPVTMTLFPNGHCQNLSATSRDSVFVGRKMTRMGHRAAILLGHGDQLGGRRFSLAWIPQQRAEKALRLPDDLRLLTRVKS
jgi:hypothetical protein